MGSLHTIERWEFNLEPSYGRQGVLPVSTSRVRNTHPNHRRTIICMVDEESTQEKRQDHIQDGQQILRRRLGQISLL